MAKPIPSAFKDLFDKQTFAHMATIMPDGQPQVTPVWCGYDGTHVLVNSAEGRRKDLNVRRDPRVALSMCDPDNAYRYLEIRGSVVEITTDGAVQHIDALAKHYLGKDRYPYHNDSDTRVIYKIAPEHYSSMG